MVVTVITVVVSFMAGLAFRKRFDGDSVVFYLMIGSLVAPGLVLGIGVGLICSSARHRGELVHHRARRAPVLDAAVRRAGDVRRDVALRQRLGGGGARPRRQRAGRPSGWWSFPILAPGLVAVALFGFTLSYDEFTRTLQTAGSLNTLPLEIWSMTLNVTSPSLYALGTVTTIDLVPHHRRLPRHHRADPEAARGRARRHTEESTDGRRKRKHRTGGHRQEL